MDFENNPLSDLENTYNNDLQNKDNKMDALPEASQKPYNLRYKPKRKRLSDIYCSTTPECLENENGPSDELLAKYLQEEEYHRMLNSTIKKTKHSVKEQMQKKTLRFNEHRIKQGVSEKTKLVHEVGLVDCLMAGCEREAE